MGNPAEARVLDAVKRCCEQYGVAKVTIDDVVAESGVSRATIYRLFPGGRDVLFEALRVRELNEFFDVLTAATGDASTLDDLVVQLVVTATVELRADQHLALMLASEPGEVLSQLTLRGLPRIIRVATVYLVPMLRPYLDRATAEPFIDLLVRLTISHFLAPSDRIDLGDPESARTFLHPIIQTIPARTPALTGPAVSTSTFTTPSPTQGASL